MQSTKSTNQLSDEVLVERIVKTNDTHLFSQLYDRYAKVVYNKCLGFSKSKEEAQDLTHDIFIQLFIKLRTFKGNSKFSTWLYSFTYNFCVNYVQRDKHKKNEKRIVDESNISDEIDDGISDEFLFQLKAEKLKRAMDIIDPSDKMILMLKYQDDMSIKELQEALQIGASAVKMRLKRAKEKVVNIYENLE
ncbi:RNA polymerase sigma factor [Urechidicola croceus]|uniref:RNA polymerase subunit sigma-70 n=1 Tax=Urechidicola croceus TaxID=1850246 RepID=A0A1D8PAR3_9FLAO|nr:sigma-70 family RNA polymerase sigma factor [Urechidicola croceus]AOW21635.1 RNA polymerase subunit sigma-70 [Urechidicola croceus]